ncbi:MAG: hypothetical protein K9L68_06245 [Spirochaetales bacterium]|nr:hypothetical protein [Spirochaetales bacterium]MCF7938182.1 hypothetical protein [Spirochaetales bacterium]
MIKLQLQIVRHKPGLLVLDIARWNRIVFFGIAVLIALGIALRGFSPMPAAFLVAAAAAGFYSEALRVDRARGTITSRFGLLFAARRRSMPMESARRLRIRTISAGGKRVFRRVTLEFSDGEPWELETEKLGRSPAQSSPYRSLADFLDIPLIEE